MSDSSPAGGQAHWDAVYDARDEEALTWFQAQPEPSLALIQRAGGLSPGAAILDVGGGASRLVDFLVARGCGDVTVLDLSRRALDLARTRLEGARVGAAASKVAWTQGDVTLWTPPRTFTLWHDRAVFHFLTGESQRQAYVRTLERALAQDGQAIIGTFALDGPEKCSGLPVVRYDAPSLCAALGPGFELLESLSHDHVTPLGRHQSFQFCRLRRRPMT